MNERPLTAIEAEHGVLGALMIKPDMCEEIGSFLSANDFSDDDSAMLYTLILSSHSKGVKPDAITLSEIARELPSGDDTMIAAAHIARNVPSASNALPYARIVVERAMARKLYFAGQRIMELAQTKGVLAAQISEAQQSLFELNAYEQTQDVRSYRELLDRAIDRMDSRLNGNVELGIDFGIEDLDKIVKSLRPGNLVIIAGKPGTGKTVLGTTLADKIAIKDGKSALIFSLEMSADDLIDRSMAAAGGVDKGWIDRGGSDSDEGWPALTAAVGKLQEADVRVCDKGSLTFSRICNIARFEHRVRPLHLIVVDYLTLIRPDANDRFATKSQEIGSFTRGFKALAKELGLPIVVLAQFNRASETRSAADSEPRMSDLRDSGEIEQDADIVILGHRPDDNRGRLGVTHWNVAKVRHAKPDKCSLLFQGSFQRFVQIAPGSIPDEQEEAPRNSGKGSSGRYIK